jgi:hypothetical protein
VVVHGPDGRTVVRSSIWRDRPGGSGEVHRA